MSVRLHEVHPAIVHFPIAVLPLAIGADLALGLAGLAGLGVPGFRVPGAERPTADDRDDAR